jgi:hypothetical protein
MLTHPLSHLPFHEGHEEVEQSEEGWVHVDIMHAFGTNRVAILEKNVFICMIISEQQQQQ